MRARRAHRSSTEFYLWVAAEGRLGRVDSAWGGGAVPGGVFFLFAGLAIAMLKMWNWMEMNRNTHTREIKRVEMQLAGLAEKTK